MKKLLTFLFCAIALSSFAQSTESSSSDNVEINTPDKTSTHSNLEIHLSNFPGGEELFKEDLLQYLSENETGPDYLRHGEKVTISYLFVTDTEGSIQYIAELPKSGKLDKEALYIMNKYPSWNPHEANFPNEAVYFSLPVTFVGE